MGLNIDILVKTIQSTLRQNLTPSRYSHSLRVSQQAELLAKHYKVNQQDAVLAGLLHDIAKEMEVDRQVEIIQSCHGLHDDEDLRRIPTFLLHARTGCVIAKQRFGIEKPEILDSIQYHVTGRGNMSMLEKIIYIADKTSLDRSYPSVDDYRILALKDLDRCLFTIIKQNIQWLVKQNKDVAIDTWAAYHGYHPDG